MDDNDEQLLKEIKEAVERSKEASSKTINWQAIACKILKRPTVTDRQKKKLKNLYRKSQKRDIATKHKEQHLKEDTEDDTISDDNDYEVDSDVETKEEITSNDRVKTMSNKGE